MTILLGAVKEDPSVLLWTYFFIAQQYDQLRRTDRALEYIDKVLQHTPTLIEGYMVKAKIYKVCTVHLRLYVQSLRYLFGWGFLRVWRNIDL